MARTNSSKRTISRRITRTLDLITSGLKDPASIPVYVKNRYEKKKTNFEYELYRRQREIPRQRDTIHELLELEEFVLVILDSCRYDIFEELYPEYLSGSLDRVWSSGNWTQKWMERTWTGTYDLTYISTTPYSFDYAHRENDSRYRPSKRFEEVIDVIGEEWNPVLSTTPPEPVTDTTLQHIGDTETTRAVVHYMQPHAPYIGETRILQWDTPDARIDELLEYAEDQTVDANLENEAAESEDSLSVTELVTQDLDYQKERKLKRENYESIDSQFKQGKISEKELREAYRDNLEHVLSEVQRLVSYLDCPVVVTADHGEHLGDHFDEIPRLTHPDRTHPVLREVPWLVVDEKNKPQNELSDLELQTNHDSTGEEDMNEETITDRLEALGYK